MTTEKKTNYDKDELLFVEAAQKLLDKYDINKSDLAGILDDQVESEKQKEFFVITRLSRGDIQALIDQEMLPAMNLEEISDEVMEQIARKMGDAFTESTYWDSLTALVRDLVIYH